MFLTEDQEKIIRGEICPYCGIATTFIDSSAVYGKSYGMIYACLPCGAYVGVHEGSTVALGRLANAELREWKKKAHASFDRIWKKGKMKRGAAYKWLSENLKIPPEYTHIGMFSVDTCKKVIKICDAKQGK